jgi:hypothetical protein
MIRFKTFNVVTAYSSEIDNFTKRVNSWLDSHTVLDVQRTMDKSILNNWMVAGIETSLSYVIKYEDAPAENSGSATVNIPQQGEYATAAGQEE